MGPDTRKIGATRGRFNGRFKKSAEPVGGLLAKAARSGYTVRTTSTEARHGEGSEAIEPRGQKAEAGEISEEGRRVVRSGKVAQEVVSRAGDTELV
jgi:hypothetical protein